jgi:hypothetical protein
MNFDYGALGSFSSEFGLPNPAKREKKNGRFFSFSQILIMTHQVLKHDASLNEDNHPVTLTVFRSDTPCLKEDRVYLECGVPRTEETYFEGGQH